MVQIRNKILTTWHHEVLWDFFQNAKDFNISIKANCPNEFSIIARCYIQVSHGHFLIPLFFYSKNNGKQPSCERNYHRSSVWGLVVCDGREAWCGGLHVWTIWGLQASGRPKRRQVNLPTTASKKDPKDGFGMDVWIGSHHVTF